MLLIKVVQHSQVAARGHVVDVDTDILIKNTDGTHDKGFDDDACNNLLD